MPDLTIADMGLLPTLLPICVCMHVVFAHRPLIWKSLAGCMGIVVVIQSGLCESDYVRELVVCAISGMDLVSRLPRLHAKPTQHNDSQNFSVSVICNLDYHLSAARVEDLFVRGSV